MTSNYNNNIKDPQIKESLVEYKDRIDNKKPDKLSVSQYKVEKPWGHEIWLELNESYVYKLIHIKKGHRCSLQSHDFKFETNYIIEGVAESIVEDENGVLQSKIYEKNNGYSVPTGRKHRITAITDMTILEVSTPYLNDVIRYQDDSNRPSGKINIEHQ